MRPEGGGVRTRFGGGFGAAAPNVVRSAQAQLTDEGTWDVTERTTTHRPAVRTARGGTALRRVTTAAGVNQTDAPDGSGGGVNREVEVDVSLNDHGSMTTRRREVEHLPATRTARGGAAGHTDTVESGVNQTDVPDGSGGGVNREVEVTVALNDHGSLSTQRRTREYHRLQGGGTASGGGSEERVVSVINETEGPAVAEGRANTEASVSVAVNDHGSLSVTKLVRRHLRKSAAAVTDFATETRRTVTTVNDEGDAPTGGTNVVRSATPNGRGGTTIQETAVTPKPVDSGWKTWTSTQRTATGTFRYRHGIRVFKNLKDCPTPPATHNATMSVGINQYGLYDGQMSYVDFAGFTASGGSSHMFGGYATATKTITDSNGDRWDANVIAYYGSGNEGAEAQDAAKGILLAGVHLGRRCYIRSVTKAGGTK